MKTFILVSAIFIIATGCVMLNKGDWFFAILDLFAGVINLMTYHQYAEEEQQDKRTTTEEVVK